MKTLKFIGKLFLAVFILLGVFAAFMNRRNVAVSDYERVTVETIYSSGMRDLLLITVDGEEYLFFKSKNAGGLVKK